MVRSLGLLLLVACGDVPCQDMTAGPGGLSITASEHPTGWQEPACDACHLRGALHRRGCTPGVDLEAVRQQVEQLEGNDGCASCHGENGVFE